MLTRFAGAEEREEVQCFRDRSPLVSLKRVMSCAECLTEGQAVIG